MARGFEPGAIVTFTLRRAPDGPARTFSQVADSTGVARVACDADLAPGRYEVHASGASGAAAAGFTIEAPPPATLVLATRDPPARFYVDGRFAGIGASVTVCCRSGSTP